jgi:hypothetical protein
MEEVNSSKLLGEVMSEKHVCDEYCTFGYEDEKEQRRCLVAAKKRWDEMAPGIYEFHRKWIDEEEGCEDIEITFKLPAYVAWELDLKRIKRLYFELYKIAPGDKDWELIQSCFTREKFLECWIYRDTMATEIDKKMADSNYECERILKFHNRINRGAIDRNDAIRIEIDEEDSAT